MENNLNTKRSINAILYLGWILFFLSIWFKCGNSIPGIAASKEVKGTFEPVTPNQIPLTKEIISEKTKKRPENANSYVDNQVEKYYKDLENRLFEMAKENDSLRQNFATLPEDLKQKEYEKVIEPKLFEQKYDNKDLTASFNGVVVGNIKEVKFTYEIKPKETPVTKFRLLAGVGIANTITFDKPLFNANLGFQNKKGNILRVGYDSEKRFLVGYDLSIFKITR